MSSHCSNSCRRVNRGVIFDLLIAFDGCGDCVVGYLIGGEKSDQILILFKTVELLLHVGVVMD